MAELDEGLEETQERPFSLEYARPDRAVKPIYLLADSQILFWKPEGKPFLAGVKARIERSSPRAAYVGASNGDDPTYYSIFEAAMEEVGITERRMIPADPGAADLDFVDAADLILLSGGDVERGWRAFEANGLKQVLVRRYYEGALLIGISAGAVQLGLGGWGTGGFASGRLVDTLRILPHVVGAHEEGEDWASLKAAVLHLGGHVRGYGIPLGSGFIYHPDHAVEPLRRPLIEIRVQGGDLRQVVLLPGDVRDSDAGSEGDDPLVN